MDQHALGSQTSPRAAGLTSKADTMPTMARLRHEACEAFERFESEMGRTVDFHRSGSLRAAYTDAAVERVRIAQETAAVCGIEATPDRRRGGRAAGASFQAGRGRARSCTCRATGGWIRRGSRSASPRAAGELGARLRPFTPVQSLLSDRGRATGVMTPRGEIRAPVVVDAAGGWTARVAAGAGIRLPLIPVRHQLFITEPIAGVEPLQPIVRLVEASVYVRYEQGGLLFGGYEDAPRVLGREGLPPGFEIASLELDLGVLRALVSEVAAHFPVLRDAKIAVHRGGAPTMTPDGRPIVGRVPGLDGLFVASGCCVGGLSLSPAAGRALADLIVDGKSDPDLAPISVERFADGSRDPAALEAACVAQYARRYTH